MRERCRARDFGGSTCYKLPREDVVEDAESLTLFGIQVCAECVGLGPHGATRGHNAMVPGWGIAWGSQI